MFINISNTIYIPKVEEYLLQIITSELTHENPLYIEAKKCNRPTFGISKVIINFEVDSFGGIYIPKGYLNRLFSITNDLGIKLEINDARNIIPFDKIYDHNINLRPYQYTALENIAQHNNGLLVAPAGSGKTIMGISLILMCNQKCLWITHTKQLLNQFVDRIQQFVNIPETDIGLIQKGSWDLDKPVTAGLVQTLIRDEDKLNSISNSFGNIIIDECHHTPSTTFTKIIKNMNSYYLYGLTATPDRRDGLENIMLQNIGPIRYEVSRNAVAHKIITPVIIPRYINTNAPDMIEYGKLLSFLVEDDVRNNTIISDVLNEAKQGNICIVATERVNHVEILYKRIKKYWDKTVAVVGKNSDKDRDIALNSLNSGEATVLICTSHLLGEGFDHAPLNRLFICLPFRNASRCEQLVGRVQRISPNKNDALIYDYIDNHGLTKNQFINYSGKPCRKAVYEKLGCIIK